MTIGPIEWFMTEDHVRIDALLARAEEGDLDSYARFRRDLLRHIALEEKVLLPAMRKRDPNAFPHALRLRSDHCALAKLLGGMPNADVIARIRELIAEHNALEEGPEGLYSVCDELLAGETDTVLARMRAYPAVPIAKHLELR